MAPIQSDPVQQHPLPEQGDSLCPVTHLPIVQDPEWKDIALSPDFRISFSLLDGNIFVCRMSGYATRDAAQKGFHVWKELLKKMIPESRPYAFLIDFSMMKGATIDARFQYIRMLKSDIDRRLTGIFFFGASAFMRVSVKIGIRMNAGFNVRLVKNYRQAVQEAQRSLRKVSRKPAGGSNWTLQLEGFSLRYELINAEAMLVTCSGYMDKTHVEPIKKMMKNIRQRTLEATASNPGRFFFILNLTGINGSRFNARAFLLEGPENLYVSNVKPVYIVYGAKPMLKTTINVTRVLLPFKIILVKDHEAALNIIHQENPERSDLRTDLQAPAAVPAPGPGQTDLIQRYVGEMLDFLGNVNWEGYGFYDRKIEIEASHPLKPVFDAISLIKTEIDLLFQERKTAEEELRESEEKFKSLSQNAPEIIYTLDTNSEITYVNPAWEHILGYKRKEVVGRLLWEFADALSQAQIRQLLKGRSEIIRDSSISLLHKDGSPRMFSMSCAPNFNSTGQLIGMVGFLKDVTEHRRLEAQFQQAQKMEAIGTLAGGIAHDFNNLLMGIQGYVSLMLLKKSPGDPDFEKLKNIEVQIQRGADLTRQVLGFARAGKYQVKPTDLNELVEKSAEMFGRTKKEIKIHQRLQPDLWTVEIDQGQIEQVLLNIYINAWQAMPAGGDLYLSTQNISLDDHYTKPYEIKAGNYAKLSVTDTGIGMDEKVQKRIFEPFFTTKEMGRGTGLGLASAYGIIKGHGGIINVYSEKGHGSTFTIYIPASERAPVWEKAKQDDIPKGSETVLLIDDEEMVLNVSREILQILGYKVIASNKGREAVEIYRNKVHEIHLVVVDMIMPDMSGLEVFKALRNLSPDLRVILSSGYSLDGEATRIMELGCNGFIQKPFDMRQIAQKVREVLDKP